MYSFVFNRHLRNLPKNGIISSMSFTHKHQDFRLSFVRFSSSPSSKEFQLNVNLYPETKKRLAAVSGKLESLLSGKVIDLQSLVAKRKDLEMETNQHDFWERQENAQTVLFELSRIKGLMSRVEGWKSTKGDIEALLELHNSHSSSESGYFPVFF
jgi:hypothetical protein